jgi:hypothetical protein
MKKAYKLYKSNVQHLEVVEKDREFYRKERRGGIWDFSDPSSKKTEWRPLEFYMTNPLAPKPDIWHLSNDILILEETALAALDSVIEECGELYDQPVDGRVAAAFHVQRIVLPTSEDWDRDPVFEYDMGPIIHSIIMTGGSLSVVSGATSPELDFKSIVEANGLSGISFSEEMDLSRFYDSSERNE